MKRTISAVAICILLLGVAVQAQAPPAPPKPGPEVKRLAYFLGTWKTEGEAKPAMGSPGGKFSSTDKNAWMSGGFFLTGHSDGMQPEGPVHAIDFWGYDTNAKVYTYHEFTNTGEQITATGTVTGDTWNFTSHDKMGDMTIDIRVTIKEVSKTEYTFKLDFSQNGGAFSTIMESTSKKVVATPPPAPPKKN